VPIAKGCRSVENRTIVSSFEQHPVSTMHEKVLPACIAETCRMADGAWILDQQFAWHAINAANTPLAGKHKTVNGMV
jgi:hypothetical protein